MKLDLQLGEKVQGECSIKQLNLMLVFQVNCPGCLSRALPELNSFSEQFPDLNAFALSTAFEDFSLNNLNTTRALCAQGELTRSCKQYFTRLGCSELPYQINVPVVMDYFLGDEKVSGLKELMLNQLEADSLPPKVSGKFCDLLEQRLLPMARTGRTFLNNELQGTPSWFVFDDQLNVLDSWFGHKDEAWVRGILESHLE